MNLFKFLSKKQLLVSSSLVLSVIVSYLIPLIKFWNTTIIQDWGYFNGLSHVVRSCIIHYKTIPIHDPWVLGGTDIMANPQSRVFSPFVLFDILFTAPFANLFALIVIGIVGVFGFYRLLRHLKISETISVIGSAIFINASWFSLHYCEGHIIFGSFQLLGLAFYYILRIQEKKYKIFYALLNAFYILDGAIYAFIFTNLLLVVAIVTQVHTLSIKAVLKSIVKHKKTVLLSGILFILFASAKLLPFLWLHGSRSPILEFRYLNIKTILHCFYNPFQYLGYRPAAMEEIKGLGFHELGAYIGIPATLLILYLIISKPVKLYIKYIIIAVLFFWIGSGWLPGLNPWKLFQKIPVINNAHIQSRLFILAFLMFVVLLCFALEHFKTRFSKIALITLFIILLAESVVVSSYPFIKVYQDDYRIYDSKIFKDPIQSTTIQKTVRQASEIWGRKFLHYFQLNTGAKYANDPAVVRGDIKTIEDSSYKGEIYLLNGRGDVKLESYTPGVISLNYKLDTVSDIQLNTNYLLGWRSKTDAIIFSERGLLTLQPSDLSGTIVLKYRPTYLYIIIPLYIFGLFLLAYFYFSRWRKVK